MLAPTAEITTAVGGPLTGRSAIAALGRRLGGEVGRKTHATRRVEIGGHAVAEVSGERRVSLGSISERLSGVVCYVSNSVLIGDVSIGRAAVLGGIVDPDRVDIEVQRFVRQLVERGRVDFAGTDGLVYAPSRTRGTGGVGAGGARATKPSERRARLATHTVVESEGTRILRRARFACGPDGCGAELE